MVELIVPGEPVGKGRPRFTVQGGRAIAYTPKATKEYEDIIKQLYILQYNEMQFVEDEPLELEIRACYGIPKSTSKALRERMLSEDIACVKKPDIDNVVKIVCDALNGLAYSDDKQIIDIEAHKEYAQDARVEIRIAKAAIG